MKIDKHEIEILCRIMYLISEIQIIESGAIKFDNDELKNSKLEILNLKLEKEKKFADNWRTLEE